MNSSCFKCCQSILRAFIVFLFLKLLKLTVKNVKVTHGNNYKHIKNEEKKRKRNCFKYNYSNFGVFFSQSFFSYPDKRVQSSCPTGRAHGYLPLSHSFLMDPRGSVRPALTLARGWGSGGRGRPVSAGAPLQMVVLVWSLPLGLCMGTNYFVFLPSLLRYKLLPC